MMNEHFSDLVNSAVGDAVRAVERETLINYTDEKLKNKLYTEEKYEETKGPSSMIDLPSDTSLDTVSIVNQIAALKEWSLKIKSSDFGAAVEPSKKKDSVDSDKKEALTKATSHILAAYLFYRNVLNDVLITSLVDFDNDIRTLNQRLTPELTTYHLTNALKRVGIKEPFSYKVCDRQGKVLFAEKNDKNCNLYDKDACSLVIRHYLFEGLLMSQRYAGYLEIHFYYSNDRFILSEPFAYPMFTATAILIIIYILGLLFLIRQYNFEKSKRAFAQNLTHELKTPLTSIVIATDMLTGSHEQTPEMKHKLSQALKSETKRLSFLVEKVLQFTLLEERKIFFKKEKVDVHEVLEETFTVYSVKCAQLGGKMELQLDADHPTVFVDKLHFKNVIFNLIDNAIKYRKMDIPPIVKISTYHTDNNHIAIAIEDNGIGISKKDRDLIFKKYYRVEQGNVHNVKGFGLGLSYVDKIVKSMHGRIKVSGKKGEGTTMTVVLPAVDQI